MSKPAANPFFAANPFLETDYSKFMDVSKFADFSKLADMSKFADASKAFGDFKVPAFNMDALIACQKKNIETLTAANQAAFEGLQAVARRQAELVRQNFEATAGAVQSMLSSPNPADRVSKQAEVTKSTVERSIANLKELSDLISRSQCQTIETVGNRVCESIDEMQGILKTGTSS